MNQTGSVTPLALGLALITLAVAGVAVDGTRAFLLRRTLQNAADAAALAAAGEIDRRDYYASGGREVALRPAAARRVAHGWLGRRGIYHRARVDAARDGVGVVLRARVDTLFLRFVGIDSVPVAAVAEARPLDRL